MAIYYKIVLTDNGGGPVVGPNGESLGPPSALIISPNTGTGLLNTGVLCATLANTTYTTFTDMLDAVDTTITPLATAMSEIVDGVNLYEPIWHSAHDSWELTGLGTAADVDADPDAFWEMWGTPLDDAYGVFDFSRRPLLGAQAPVADAFRFVVPTLFFDSLSVDTHYTANPAGAYHAWFTQAVTFIASTVPFDGGNPEEPDPVDVPEAGVATILRASNLTVVMNTLGGQLETLLQAYPDKGGNQQIVGAVDMNGHRITGLAEATAPNDLVSLAQLQGLAP